MEKASLKRVREKQVGVVEIRVQRNWAVWFGSWQYSYNLLCKLCPTFQISFTLGNVPYYVSSLNGCESFGSCSTLMCALSKLAQGVIKSEKYNLSNN